VMSVCTGSALLSVSDAGDDDVASVECTLLADDGSYGLPSEHAGPGGAASSDSEGVAL